MWLFSNTVASVLQESYISSRGHCNIIYWLLLLIQVTDPLSKVEMMLACDVQIHTPMS